MRYAKSDKLEIIRLVEGSHLSARRTLAKLGIPRTTFYRWYDRYLQRGAAGLHDQSPKPKHVWNRIPDEVRRKIVKLALKETDLSPRELAVTFTDKESYFVSEASVYRKIFDFRQGETIHTENSRKFEIDALKTLIGQCGWQMADSWVDKNSLFSVLLFKAI